MISEKVADDLETAKKDLSDFIKDPAKVIENKLEFQKVCPIDFEDSQLELVPEAYLDQKPPTIEEVEVGMDMLVREMVAFIIRSKREGLIRI